LSNPYVAIVEDLEAHVVRVLTDPLGVEPAFVVRTRAGYTLGRSVQDLLRVDAIENPTVDANSVAAWLLYGHNYTQGSLFEDVERLGQGTVLTLGPNGSEIESWARLEWGDAVMDHREALEISRDHLTRSLSACLEASSSFVLPLSGGLDSRLLAGLAFRLTEKPILCVAWETDEAELNAARLVVERLGVPLEVILVPGSPLDSVTETPVYVRAPDGFPVRRTLTMEIARRFPGECQINGFLGDVLLAGRYRRCEVRRETGDERDIVRAVRTIHTWSGGFLFGDRFRDPVVHRATAALDRFGTESRPFERANLFLRQPYYTALMFQLIADLSPSVTPYYSYPILHNRMQHAPQVFEALHEPLMAELTPDIADLPNATDLRSNPSTDRYRGSRWARRRSRALLPLVVNAERLQPLDRYKAVSRLVASMLGCTEFDGWVHLAERMRVLEDMLLEARVSWSWGELLQDVPSWSEDVGVSS